MLIQIFGTNKCKNTQKAIRFFKERGINIQFIDLNQKKISKGELESILRSIPLEKLIDKDSKTFKNMNLQYIAYDTKEVLLNNPLLFKTPILRNNKKNATIGYEPDIWKNWVNENQ
jgi:Spx/MgsR family transcriptional regulator